jgi:hypothetical protein
MTYKKTYRVFQKISIERVVAFSLTIFFVIIASSIALFLCSYFIIVESIEIDLTIEKFILLIGILFTFATLIITLFGIVNYFQSSEGHKRLNEIEIYYKQNAREMVVMRLFLVIISDSYVMRFLQRENIAGKLLIHIYKIVDSKDISFDDIDSNFEIEVTFIEIMKMCGLRLCSQIFRIIDSHSFHRNEYRTCIANFKKLISYYSDLESI